MLNVSLVGIMKSHLNSGDFLRTGEYLVAPQETCYLIMQADGNLCLYQGEGPSKRGPFLWGALGASLPHDKFFAAMQADGNFVIYQGEPGSPTKFIWSTGTTAAGGLFTASLQDEGSFTVNRMDSQPAPLWAVRRLRLLTYNTHLMVGSILEEGADLFRKNPILFHDEDRYAAMIQRIKDSGADIVALQEVWSTTNMDRIQNDLRSTYKYTDRGSNGATLKAGSGIVILSKFPLSEGSFVEFKGAHDWDERMATKGALAVTVDLLDGSKIRVGLTHCWTDAGGDECTNIKDLVGETLSHDRPAVMMGDFNIHRRGNPAKYGKLTALMAGRGATDSWTELHGPAWSDACATDDQIHNNLAQFFSPDRDTPAPDCIDYLYLRNHGTGHLRPVKAEVLRDWKTDIKNRPPYWYWVHQGTVSGLPSAVVFGDKICAVARSTTGTLQVAYYDGKTACWTHYTIRENNADLKSEGSPGLVWFAGGLHLFFQQGRQVYKLESADGRNWSPKNSQGGNFLSSGGVCPVVHQGNLYVFVRDPTGAAVYYHVWTNRWSDRQWVGITTPHDIAAAATGNRLCVVTRDNNGSARGGIMRGVMEGTGKWDATQIRDVTCSGPPGLTVKDGQFHMFFREPDGGGIFHRWSSNGTTWPEWDFTGHATMDAVCPVTWGDRIMLFYPFIRTPTQVYSARAMAHSFHPTGVMLDDSDHYPYMVDVIWSH